MDSDQREDFIREMYALVIEEGFLHEAPRGVTDLLPTGDVVHRPWDTLTCAKVLARWHSGNAHPLRPGEFPWQSRTTQMVVDNEPFFELSANDSAEVLSDPTRWDDRVRRRSRMPCHF